jgi:UPF0716 family protein affecting phage T7 exclusion
VRRAPGFIDTEFKVYIPLAEKLSTVWTVLLLFFSAVVVGVFVRVFPTCCK